MIPADLQQLIAEMARENRTWSLDLAPAVALWHFVAARRAFVQSAAVVVSTCDVRDLDIGLPLPERSGRYDANAFERVEHQDVLTTSHNRIALAT